MSHIQQTQHSPISALQKQLRPFQALQTVWWQRLLRSRGKHGWLTAAKQVYYTLKTTAPLLQFAATTAEMSGEDLGDFVVWARQHAEEEHEHYRWYLDDLRALDVVSDTIEQGVPDEQVLRSVGAQFALIATTHPVAVLGYFYAIECHPPNADNVQSLAQRFSIPAEGLRTILLHADADQVHRQEILGLLETYLQQPRCVEPILASALEEVTGWTTFLQSLCDDDQE